MLMEPRRVRCLAFILFFSSFFLLSAGQPAGNASADSLDALIRDHAFKVLLRRRTGIPYRVPLPANLSGITASVLRLRSSSLWTRGANSSAFRIPPRVMLAPYARRLALVYQNVGNRSAAYYDVPGYSLVAPVIGLLAYDASTTRELRFIVAGDPISVFFPDITLPEGRNSTVKCASFEPHGPASIADATSPGVCLTKRTGHFALVMAAAAVKGPPPLVVMEGGGRRWRVWVVACVAGAAGVVLGALVVVGVRRLVRDRRVGEMEGKAEAGEALETVWVGGSKMPSATMIRTQPVIEED